ncbi:hypothetical protein F4679DRAFT_368967 [Xylaria curta]|nr:hypothetical protein F4679DRAFT_368967 [Xylaria curta]
MSKSGICTFFFIWGFIGDLRSRTQNSSKLQIGSQVAKVLAAYFYSFCGQCCMGTKRVMDGGDAGSSGQFLVSGSRLRSAFKFNFQIAPSDVVLLPPRSNIHLPSDYLQRLAKRVHQHLLRSLTLPLDVRSPAHRRPPSSVLRLPSPLSVSQCVPLTLTYLSGEANLGKHHCSLYSVDVKARATRVRGRHRQATPVEVEGLKNETSGYNPDIYAVKRAKAHRAPLSMLD